MHRRIAILAVALFWLMGIDDLAHPSPESLGFTRPVSKSGSGARSSPQTSLKQNTRRRRSKSRRRRNPWRISSYGEPTAGDDPSGEDPVIRQAAVEAIGNWNGSIVVVDPNTGQILSIVNQKMGLESAFIPCSTFKPIVALGGLKEGIITLETRLWVRRRKRIDVTEALAVSDNPFFSKLGQMLGFDRVARYARDFGFGEKAGWDIPGESPGHFPEAPPKKGGVGYLAYFGQDMSVTLLQLAAAISAVANGGTLYYLQYPRAPDELSQFQPRIRRQLHHLREYLPQLQQGLAAAVLYGTATSAYCPEEQIYGKTGTCSEDGARLGWFASYSGQQQPKYVVVVLLRGGKTMYGPHAAEIAGRLYRDLKQKERGGLLGPVGVRFPRTLSNCNRPALSRRGVPGRCASSVEATPALAPTPNHE